MFENGLKLKIKGKPFDSETEQEFKLLDKIEQQSNSNSYSTLIYGQNGSGKTTICNALDEIKMDCLSRTFNSSLVDLNNNEYFNFNNIFVYNEKFIDNNVKFKSEGLETIVLLGEDLDLDKEIFSLKEKKQKKESELINIDLSIYGNNKHPLNPEYSWNKIISILKSEGNWATRKKQILSLSRNAAVNDAVVLDIVSNHKQKTTVDEFNNLLTDFTKIKSNNFICNYIINDLPVLESMDNIKNLLNTIVSKKENDQLANDIYDVIDKFGNNRLIEIASTFDSNTKYCPYCFQKLEDSHKELILNKIKQIISKEENDFINQIESHKIRPYSCEELPSIIPDNIKFELEKNLISYNIEAEIINNLLDDKKNKLYTTLDFENSRFIDAQFLLLQTLKKVENIINTHNNNFIKAKDIETLLLAYNNSLSWETIEKEYKTYQQNLIIKHEKENKVHLIKNELLQFNNEILALESKKKNIDGAIKEINNGLSYIFMSKKRLQIINNGNDKYSILSRGKSIEAKDLSTGERNIISLCYFFSSIGKGKNIKERYTNEYLICIDDPITSFDHNNKIGIYSYLRQVIHLFITGNIHTRFIFLTHNYDVAYNLEKMINDVYSEVLVSKKPIMLLKLHDFNLTKGDMKQGANQYNILLNNILAYANNEESELTDITIGNSLRRVLEIFSSFEFNTSIEFLNRVIKNENNDSHIELLKNYMYRILVNNESHTKIAAYSYDEIDKFEFFTPEEKKNVAKISLILLKKLNYNHIYAYLKNKVNIIEEWEQNYTKLII